MSLASRVRRAANRILAPAGLAIVRKGANDRATLAGALANARRLGVEPRTVIDVGAAYGYWARECANVFPDARYLLVEPLEEFRPFLEQRVAELDAEWIAAAVSSASGIQEFHVHHDLVGSSLRDEAEGPAAVFEQRRVATTTVDALVERRAEPPFLLKVDVQGGELDVLAGASRTLAATELALLETSFFNFFVDGPDVATLIAWMRKAAFVPYDILGLAYRPLDGALAQVDLLFAPEASRLRSSHVWTSPGERAEQDAAMRRRYERRLAALRR